MRTFTYINNPEVAATLAENIVTVEANNLPPVTARTTYFFENGADLILKKYADKSKVYVGELLTYTIEVNNNGPSTVIELLITDVYPKEAFLISIEVDNGTYSIVDGVIIWNINALNKGENSSATIVIKPIKSGIIKNDAWILSKGYDPNPYNDHCEVLTTVISNRSRGVDFF